MMSIKHGITEDVRELAALLYLALEVTFLI
jgi:hypothetical protein